MPHILLIEDTPDVREVLSLALTDEGHSVAVAASRAEAESLMPTQSFDLMIADVVLPDGDGVALSDAVVSRGMPSLLITGDLDTARRLAREGRPCLAKPFAIGALLDAVDALLGG